MPSALPDGDPAPVDGVLPSGALTGLAGAPFGVYVHVPFCTVRCGYCDFNTYTVRELGGPSLSRTADPDGRPLLGANVESYAGAALAELDLARRVLPGTRPVDTVFFGGGTPTLLPPADLVRVLHGIRDRFGLADDAEVTTEANPDSVTSDDLRALADGGFTRVSIGMQSVVPHVLKTLERTHDPAGVARAVQGARAAGLDVSVDLIYGTPGESVEDWAASLDAATALDPDHISAYALVVEQGTRLAAQVRRGEVAIPDDDDEATKYELADTRLSAAGFGWYEVSNWAASPAARCRHNQLYWRGDTWWGVGPGAHSHVGGVRWWNVKHPRAYAGRLASGESPAAARETLTAAQRADEAVLLGVRLVDGLAIADLPSPTDPTGDGADTGSASVVACLIADGLVDGAAALQRHRVVLTLRGRLLADTVVRRLLGW
ncbi:MAG: coproporphyrinogen-III oxidase family protein [Nostocoides sp.]